MAKSQQDQSWPYRPPVNFYPPQQVYNLPYQHAGICQDTCCQQPRVPKPYRSLPYPPIAYPHQGNSFTRQTSQSVPQYVPVNPYLSQRNCPSQHQRNSLIHRPIPHGRYDYNDYYRFNNQRLVLNKSTNPNEYVHDNSQFSTNQYAACSHYTSQQSESSLPNIDVRQFLATWQDKDEDVTDSSEHIKSSTYQVNFPDPYQPLDCTKRNDTIGQSCEFDQSRAESYYTKPDTVNADPGIPFQQQYSNPPTLITGIPNVNNVSSDQLLTESCVTQALEQHCPEKDLNFMPYERSIEKICNPRIFKNPSMVNNVHKNMVDNQCVINENIYHSNIKDFKPNSERSQYHLSASLESDDLFDDINRRKEEKQKNVVHPLRHDERFNQVVLNSNKKQDIPHIPVKPSLNLHHQSVPNVGCELPEKVSDSSNMELKSGAIEVIKNAITNDKCEFNSKNNLRKYSLEFESKCADSNTPLIVGYNNNFDLVHEEKDSASVTETLISEKPADVLSLNNAVFNNSDPLDKNLLNSATPAPEASQSSYPDNSTSYDQVIIAPQEKKVANDSVQEMEISSDDIDISIASSGDLVVDEDRSSPVNIKNLKECLKLPQDVSSNKTESVPFPPPVVSEETVSSSVVPSNEKNDHINESGSDTIFLTKSKQCIDSTKKSPLINSSFNEMNNNEVEMVNYDNDTLINSGKTLQDLSNDSSVDSCTDVVTVSASTNIMNGTSLASESEGGALQNIAINYQDSNSSEDSTDSIGLSGNITQFCQPSSNCGELASEKTEEIQKRKVLVTKCLKDKSTVAKPKRYQLRTNIKYKCNAVLNWKLKNRIPYMYFGIAKSVVSRAFRLKKYVYSLNKICLKNILKRRKHCGNFRKSRTLDILTECSNTNCDVNCVIYQSDIDSCNNFERNSIIAEEVHLCSKCHQDQTDVDCQKSVSVIQKTYFQNNANNHSPEEPLVNSPGTETQVTLENPSKQNQSEIGSNPLNSVDNDSSNTKIKELIANFFSSGKAKIESEITTSYENQEMVSEIIIKDAEEVRANKWSLRGKILKGMSQKRTSIKCSLAWDKIFSSLFNTINNDSLELGPAKIHLTLSPKNENKGKSSERGEINIFKAIINAKKLILKRNGVLEERIPKMVIKKSEGQGYRSFIKDVRVTSIEKLGIDPPNFPESTSDPHPNVEIKSNDTAETSSVGAIETMLEFEDETQHEKKNLHHCLLCQRSFFSVKELEEHETSKSHKHLDIIQRNALHKVHNALYGCDHPNTKPLSDYDKEFLSWKPFYPGFNHNYHHELP